MHNMLNTHQLCYSKVYPQVMTSRKTLECWTHSRFRACAEFINISGKVIPGVPGMTLPLAQLKESFFAFVCVCVSPVCVCFGRVWRSSPSGGVVCQVFTEYARACAHADSPLNDWREHIPQCGMSAPLAHSVTHSLPSPVPRSNTPKACASSFTWSIHVLEYPFNTCVRNMPENDIYTPLHYKPV